MEPKKTVTLRVPAELLAAIAEQAQAEDRSINAQIVRLLKQAMEVKHESA